jgi:hypothetical protein
MAEETPLDLNALLQQDIAETNPEAAAALTLDKPEKATPEPVATEGAEPAETDEGTEADAGAGETKGDDKPSEGEDSPTAIREYIKEQLGTEAHAWLDTFKTDEDLLKGIHEQNKLIGKKSEDAEIGKWVKSLGVSAQELADLVASKGVTPVVKPSGDPSSNGEWKSEWITIDKDGKVTPTAKAPSDIAERIKRRQVEFAEAVYDDDKLAERVRAKLLKDVDARTQAIRNESAEQAARTAQEQSFQAWQKSKETLFVSEGGTITPLGERVNEYLNSGKINPQLDWVEQGELALKMAVADAAPKPTKKPIPAKAKHQVAPAGGTAAKMTDEAFFKKYGDDLLQFATWKETGELPKT